MEILFVAPYVPSRIRVRPFQLIKQLSNRHRVHVIALDEAGEAEAGGVDEIASTASSLRIIPHSKLRGYWQSLLALPTPSPMCAGFCRSKATESAIADMMSSRKFDLVHIEHLRAAHFAPSNAPVLFDSVDCLTGLFYQMARSKKNPVSKLVMMEEALCLRKYEPRVLRKFDRVIITSQSEREQLVKLDRALRVDVLPNGVDTQYFTPMETTRHLHRFVFSGKMSYHPNAHAAAWFAENVFPSLKARWPDAEFAIVGSGPPQKIMDLAQTPGITVTGYVDDIRPYLGSASIAVAPMQVAVGVQNKVLEAMAMGLPVVTSRMASRAFGENCPGIREADSANEVIEAVSELVDNREKAEQVGKLGRAEVVRKYSWESSAEQLEHIYEEMLAAQNDQWRKR